MVLALQFCSWNIPHPLPSKICFLSLYYEPWLLFKSFASYPFLLKSIYQPDLAHLITHLWNVVTMFLKKWWNRLKAWLRIQLWVWIQHSTAFNLALHSTWSFGFHEFHLFFLKWHSPWRWCHGRQTGGNCLPIAAPVGSVCFNGGPYKLEQHSVQTHLWEDVFRGLPLTDIRMLTNQWGIWHSLSTTGAIPHIREGTTSKTVSETWTYMAEWLTYSLPKRLKCVHSHHK